jgi:hypothetical protein
MTTYRSGHTTNLFPFFFTHPFGFMIQFFHQVILMRIRISEMKSPLRLLFRYISHDQAMFHFFPDIIFKTGNSPDILY